LSTLPFRRISFAPRNTKELLIAIAT